MEEKERTRSAISQILDAAHLCLKTATGCIEEELGRYAKDQERQAIESAWRWYEYAKGQNDAYGQVTRILTGLDMDFIGDELQELNDRIAAQEDFFETEGEV